MKRLICWLVGHDWSTGHPYHRECYRCHARQWKPHDGFGPWHAAALLLALLPALAGAQTPAPSPSPCDPASVSCITTRTSVIALIAWSPTGESTKLMGARAEIEVVKKNLRAQARIDGTASESEFKPGDLSTVRDVEVHVAAAYDAVRLQQGLSIGPLLAVGAATSVSLKNNKLAPLPRSATFVAGLRIAMRGKWWVEGGCGAVQEWGRGVGCKATWEIRVTSRTSNVGTASTGRRWIAATDTVPGHSDGGSFAWTGMRIDWP